MHLTEDPITIAAGLDGTTGLPRQRRTVLVADLVESVSLMQQDESGVIARWREFVAAVGQSVIPATQGRMVKSLGDGLMLEFGSARDGVKAALAMHELIGARTPPRLDAPLSLRIGLHSDYVYQGTEDIYGTGVNLTARVTTLAEPGETVVSVAVRDELTDGLDAQFEDMGECYLKHIERPVHAFRVRAAGQLPAIRWVQKAAPTHLLPTIAVIPFDFRNARPEQYALGELIADGVIGRLSRTREIKVISRLSTTVLRGRAGEDGIDAKGLLGADYVLAGSYVVNRQKLLVIGELVDARTSGVVWSDRFAGQVSDLFQMHSQLCDGIASGAHRALLAQEAQAAVTRPLPSLQSYSLLLGGIGLMHRSGADQFLRTRQVLDALVDRHRLSALPHVWLAKWYVLCHTRGLIDDPARQARTALDETRRALDAEPGNALAWAMQGFVYCHLMHDMDMAMASCNRAIEWNGNESLAWLFKAMVHAFEGDGAAAMPAGRRALELSPLDPLRYYYDSLMASIAISAGEYALAIDHASQSLRANAVHLSSYRALVLAQALSGRVDEARRSLAALVQRDPGFCIDRFDHSYPSRERVPAYLERLKDAFRAAGAKER